MQHGGHGYRGMGAGYRDKWLPLLAGAILVAIAAWLPLQTDHPLQQLLTRVDHVLYDWRLLLTLPANAVDSRVVIVALDEKSLAQVGRWPWSRDIVAKLTSTLFKEKSAVVGFDVLFTEPQENPAQLVYESLRSDPTIKPDVLATLKTQAPHFASDETFATSLGDGDVVLGFVFHQDSSTATTDLSPGLRWQGVDASRLVGLRDLAQFTASLPMLQAKAAANGFLTTVPDADGILRRTPLVLRHGEQIYGSLALEMMRSFLLLDHVEVTTAPIDNNVTLEAIKLGQLSIPTDTRGQVLIPYHGPSPTFAYVSAADVLAGTFPPGVFENKLVLVGATALGLGDRIATPVQGAFPGVEVHASLLRGMLDKTFVAEPEWAVAVNLLVTTVVGFVLVAVLPRLGAWILLVVGLGIAAALVGANVWVWQSQHLSLPLAAPLLLVITLTVLYLTTGYLAETRQRGRLKNMFGQYVPPELVEMLASGKIAIEDNGELREMTVLFADIRNFTTLSESLDPGQLKRLLNRFFERMTEIIFAHHGTIDKYVGDMIMAFWGAPVSDASHARHGTMAAMEMLAALQALRAEFAAEGLPEFEIGIGVNSGPMHVGDMGSPFRRAYTVVGDAVNLASRLEGLTKYYGVGLVIGEATQQQLNDVVCRKLDRVRVKGKRQAVEVYQPLSDAAKFDAAAQGNLQRYHLALEYFWARQWQQAETIFVQLHEQQAESLYALYLERIALLKDNDPGPQWDGVYERRTK